MRILGSSCQTWMGQLQLNCSKTVAGSMHYPVFCLWTPRDDNGNNQEKTQLELNAGPLSVCLSRSTYSAAGCW